MTANRLHAPLTVALALVAAVVGINSLGVLSHPLEVAVVHSGQLAAGLAATAACWWMSRRVTGVERTWRRYMACAMAGWTIGQVFCSWYQVVRGTGLPSPSWADVGFLAMPPFGLAALLALAADHRRCEPELARPCRLVLVLDGLIVVGSLFILTWSTALGEVVRAGAATALAFAIAVAYPITDLILVVIVVLLVATRTVAHRYRIQLLPLGLGLVALSLSDSAFAYLVSTGASEVPPLATAGFIAGPALIAVAACITAGPQTAQVRHHPPYRVEWGHLLLPYVPVSMTGGLILVQAATGRHLDLLEVGGASLVVAFVVARQITTLVDNSMLVERVTEGRQRLAYQAYHDPLTGLANRTLFGEQLSSGTAGKAGPSRCSSPTSTTSSWSTTASATRRETACCAPSASGSADVYAPKTRSPGWAAMSSRSWSTATGIRARSASGSSRRCGSRSRSTVWRSRWARASAWPRRSTASPG